MLEFRCVGRPASPDIIRAFEKEIGNSLPEDYRAFLMEHDGVSGTDNATFRITYASFVDTDAVTAFYPMFEGHSIISVMRNLYGRFSDNMIPIASDPFGNQIMLGIAGRERGKVYFWDHEIPFLEDEGEDDSILEVQIDPVSGLWPNTFFLADSFTDFVHNLEDDDESREDSAE